LLRGEIYRLAHKKSLYIYFGALAAGYFFVAFIRSDGFGMAFIVSDALNLFIFLPALAGGFLFSAVYTDDLNSKNLSALVGGGAGKTQIVAAKLVMFIVTGAVVFACAPLFHCAVYAALGWKATAGILKMVSVTALRFYLLSVGYAAVSGIIVYGLQRATFAIVLYALLAFNVVSGLLAAAFGTFAPDLTNYLISGITDKIITGVINGAFPAAPVAGYFIYITIMTAVSAAVFHRKEMGF